MTSGGKDIDRALLEARDFLKAKRIHHVSSRKCSSRICDRRLLLSFFTRTLTKQELVKRYNPTHDMTQEERVAATARRVGLDKPEEFKSE